ncbi:MAG TPA: fumarylacetoacetate hydrolase family protein [Candidatus Thermoplasmatota archaeon]|nr:fumarylacetoacetate hydrolase family protein [Candidatus Thermoplasmatota archaeon]
MTFQLSVRGRAPLPAGKIVAVAKNYEEHRREMQGALGSGAAGDVKPPGDPVVFLKPTSCLVADGGAIRIPKGVANVHWETELAVVLGAPLHDASEEEAMRAVLGYAVFLDMTARDLQAEAKKTGMPWTLSKGIDTFGPVSEVVPSGAAPAWDKMELRLLVNGELRQHARCADMIHSVPKILSYISRFMTLAPGDLVATGTPAGVGACKAGDVLEASIPGVVTLRVRVD